MLYFFNALFVEQIAMGLGELRSLKYALSIEYTCKRLNAFRLTLYDTITSTVLSHGGQHTHTFSNITVWQ